MNLEEKDKILLLYIARESIRSALEGRPIRWPEDIPSSLKEPRGAFVTLHKDKVLRGCIGTFQADKPLFKIVAEMARSAAFQDPRFPPLEKEELDQVEIEISVLSPLKKGRPEDIQIGIHGIYIIRNSYHGVLLPQVAVEYGWDRETFLDHTCLKAGLSPGCWKDPQTDIYLFTAEIFSEEDFGLYRGQKLH